MTEHDTGQGKIVTIPKMKRQYPLPLGKDRTAVIEAPEDLTSEEAKKIIKFIREFLV